tara:strand:- start:5030 stop:5677 length:648 start_codon:yes stop_codon:yes gene_type:complete
MKNKSDYYLRSKYYLLEQPMEQAIKFFSSCYFDGADKFIAKYEEDRFDRFMELYGKNCTSAVIDQLTQLIDSHMSDDELAEFIETKLGSCDAAEPGESRDWLIEIRDYLNSKIDPLIRPMNEIDKLFTNYYSDDADKFVANDEQKRLDKFIKTYGNDFVIIVIEQLTELIDSQASDDDLKKFLEKKLGPHETAESEGARKWLISIRDYLKSKVGK